MKLFESTIRKRLQTVDCQHQSQIGTYELKSKTADLWECLLIAAMTADSLPCLLVVCSSTVSRTQVQKQNFCRHCRF